MEFHLKGSGPIVMVDDAQADLGLVKYCYEKSKLKNSFLGMDCGNDLVNYLKLVLQGERAAPSLILMDINMPKKDGFEVLTEIRKEPSFSELPVIMFTTSNNPEDRKRALALGANGYQVKSFDLKDYIDFFNSLQTHPNNH